MPVWDSSKGLGFERNLDEVAYIPRCKDVCDNNGIIDNRKKLVLKTSIVSANTEAAYMQL